MALVYRGLRDRWHAVAEAYDLWHCRGCGLYWLDPLPRIVAETDTHYPADYHAYHREEFSERRRPLARFRSALRRDMLATFFGYPVASSARTGWRRALLRTVLPFFGGRATYGLGPRFPVFVPGGRLLEVGVGDGAVLRLLRDLGWSVGGVDISPVACEVARTRYGILVHQGELATAQLPDASYDVILMSHVLEHASDPLVTLERARSLLSPRGNLIVVVPNAGALGFKLFGRYWGYLDPPRHLWQFSMANLQALAARAGLRVLQKGSLSTLAAAVPWVSWCCYRVEARNADKTPPSPSPVAFRAFGTLLGLAEATLVSFGSTSGEEIFVIGGRT